jgi:amino acid transporter
MNYQLSLSGAVLFIVNVIIGSGVFLNTVPLIITLGLNSYIAYIVTASIIIPLVVTCFLLAREFPGKNLYEIFCYSNNTLGFIGTFCYSISKIATSAIGITVGSQICSLLLKNKNDDIFFFIIFGLFVLFFSWCNYRNYGITFKIQCLIVVCKLFPLVTIIITMGYKLFTDHMLPSAMIIPYVPVDFYTILSTIPLIIFSFAGFESLFGIASRVKNPEKNASRTVLIGFISVVIIYGIYQYFSSIVLYNKLPFFKTDSLYNLFLSIAEILELPLYMGKLFCCAIAISALGVSYGVMYSNTRNIAHIIDKKKESIWYIIIPIIISFYGYVFHDLLSILQQLSATGTIITYIIFAILYNSSHGNKSFIHRIFACCSFFSVSIFMYVSYLNALSRGYVGYLLYFFIFILGCLLYFVKKFLCNIK